MEGIGQVSDLGVEQEQRWRKGRKERVRQDNKQREAKKRVKEKVKNGIEEIKQDGERRTVGGEECGTAFQSHWPLRSMVPKLLAL